MSDPLIVTLFASASAASCDVERCRAPVAWSVVPSLLSDEVVPGSRDLSSFVLSSGNACEKHVGRVLEKVLADPEVRGEIERDRKATS